MTTISINNTDWSRLSGKVIIITGGASGIGEAAVKFADDFGAKVVFGDVDRVSGEALEASSKTRNLTYIFCDVTSWSDQRSMFTKAFELHGKIDVVLANAGITELQDIFLDVMEQDGALLAEPKLPVLEVCLKGLIYTVKLALHYFRTHASEHEFGSLVMTGSAASYLPSSPLWTYSAAKTGVIGLLRALKTQATIEDKWTVNAVAPWMTLTGMAKHIEEFWKPHPTNSPLSVAQALLLPATDRTINGKSFFVGGNTVIEIEDALERAQPLWLGEAMSRAVDEGQIKLGCKNVKAGQISEALFSKNFGT